VPHDRRRGEHAREHDRDAEHARVDERLQVHAMRAGARELLEARAEHEQEQERLHERGNDPHAVVCEPDQLASPDDLHRPQLAAGAARRDANADYVCSCGAHLRAPVITCIVIRLRWREADSSASRIVVPVCDMKTSSSVGRATLTDLIGTPSSENRRGTNSSPPGTAKVTAPSEIMASMPKVSASAASAASSSSVSIRTRSAPTCA